MLVNAYPEISHIELCAAYIHAVMQWFNCQESVRVKTSVMY